MAKTLIGNVKGNDGRGISKIEKTATTGDVDTYTITYTDSTTSTYEVQNGDTIAIQRQIVPSAAIESSTTATKSYGVGDYLILNGVLRKVTSAIASGNQITDSNSTATTVTGELSPVADTVNDYKSVTRFAAPSLGNWNDVFTYDITRAGLYFIRLNVTYSYSDYGEATFRLFHNPNDGSQALDSRVSIEQNSASAEGINLSYGTSEVYRFKQGASIAVQCYTKHNGFSFNNYCGIHVVRIGA